MKSKAYLLLVSVLVFGMQSVASASPYPADAEASYDLQPIESYAEAKARMGETAAWGVGKREVQPHEPFPFGGGFISD